MNLSIEQIQPYSTYIYFKCIQSKGKYSFRIVKTPQCTVHRQNLQSAQLNVSGYIISIPYLMIIVYRTFHFITKTILNPCMIIFQNRVKWVDV